MGETKKDRKKFMRALCEEEIKDVFDAKESVLMKFYTLINYACYYDYDFWISQK